MSVVKRFLGDTAIYGLSTIMSRLLNFILTPLFIGKFETTVYGVFTHLYSWAALINAFLAFGMETTYFRYLQKVAPEDKPKVFNHTFLVTIFTSFVLLITLLIFLDPISIWFGRQGVQSVTDYKVYILCVGLTLVVDALAVVPFAKLRSQNRPLRYAFLKTINILLFVGFNLLFLVVVPWFLVRFPEFESSFSWFKPNWLGYVFVSNLIASFVTLLMLIPEMRAFTVKIDRLLLRKMFNYSFPIFIANVSFIINEHLDKILMPVLLPEGIGERDLGIYGAIAKIAVFLSIFVQAFRLGAEPFFFSYAKKENARLVYAMIMEYFVIAMMLVMVGLSVNIEWLKYFIKGANAVESEKYWSGLNYIPVILFNYVLLGIYMNLSIWYKLSDQTKYGLYISSVGAIITIFLCYLFIPWMSYVGAILVTSIAYLSMVGLSYIWGQRNYAIPYNISKIGMHIMLGSSIVAANYLLFHRNFWSGNFLLLLYIGFILFQERKFIREILISRS